MILSDRHSWMAPYLDDFAEEWAAAGHDCKIAHQHSDAEPADFCFFLSCGQIVPANILSLYRHNLVVHESDLPRGKGWSPLTWQILEGKNRIPAILFEAAEKIDSGVIYAQVWMEFEGHELIDELREAQANATTQRCKRFVDNYPQILDEAQEQVGETDYYQRRLPNDSLFDPDKSISDIFSLLRVAGHVKHPHYFLKIDYKL